MRERTGDLLNSTQGVLGRMSYGKPARGKHLPLVWGWWEGWKSVPAGGSPTSSPTGQFLFLLRSDRNPTAPPYLTSGVLIPALLLGEICPGTANLLSSAPAGELSQHGRCRNTAPGEIPHAGTAIHHIPPISQDLVSPPLEAKRDLKNRCAVVYEIKVSSRVSCNKQQRGFSSALVTTGNS